MRPLVLESVAGAGYEAMTSARQTHLNQALMRISRRAESADRSVLATTFVAAGAFAAMLHSADHQILYGRRGTGKTHALLYLQDLISRSGDVAVYLDLRTIGTAGGMYADSSLNPAVRGTHLLVDVLEAIHDELLAIAVDTDVGESDLLDALDTLAEAATAVEVVGDVETETTSRESRETARGIELSLTPNLRATAARRRASSGETRQRRTGTPEHRVIFGPLSRAMRAVTDALGGARLWLLLDEWSSIPLDLQPLMADLLRRSVMPVVGITVKIAAIERRARFAQPLPTSDYIGIEVGADAASAVNLDDVLTFSNAPRQAEGFFAQLFHNHASSHLARMLASPPPDADSLIQALFVHDAFKELVLAAHGVPRDAINIAALAAQHAHDQPIDVDEVRRAARDWYLRDKQAALTAP